MQLNVELPGRTSAYLVAEVRPQVSGIIRERLFTEGADVVRGRPALPDRPRHLRGRGGHRRSGPRARPRLPQTPRACAPKRFRDAGRQARREPAGCRRRHRRRAAGRARRWRNERAQLARARIDLRRTRVTSPISGRIGKSDCHARRAGHRRPGPGAGHRAAARPDVRGHHALQPGPAAAARRHGERPPAGAAERRRVRLRLCSRTAAPTRTRAASRSPT